MSLLTQTQLKVDLEGWEERLSFDLGFDETNDCTWAQRMIWIVAEVVSRCFGNNVVDWDYLKAKIDKWDSRRPKSFDPILYRPRDFEAGRYYPEIRLGHPWHGTSQRTRSNCSRGLLKLTFKPHSSHRYAILLYRSTLSGDL